ncbi:hypothetical protein [Bacillus sp. FJAT-45350]|uniref:hypothetical protein n=1 Tax=Bacillus sp. FJAT-45350 TaxID=2011014 RepID=UPI000BB7877E|nr:hypothetical protein [Bacillus sp. FJAT-45350]
MSEQKLDLILQELQKVNVRLDNLEEGQARLEHRQGKLEQRQNTLEEGQASLLARQKELYQLVRAIHDRHEETDAKLDSLTMDVHNLHGEVTSMKNDITYFDRKTGEHDREIFKIKHRM